MKIKRVFLILLLLIVIVLITVGVVYMKKIRSSEEPNTVNVANTSKEAQNNTSANTANQSTSNIDADTEANKEFAIKFMKMENNKKNMIYSPLSIKYGLSLLYEGANGKTKDQLEEVIKDLSLDKYENIEKVLSLANSVYIRDSYSEKVKEEYINSVTEKYNSEIKYDAFKNAKNINSWISEKTFDIIPKMLNDEMFQDPDLKMLLINALAIDMEWESTFNDISTHGAKFTLEDGKEVEVTTMSKEASTDSISYYKADDVISLTMDLKQYEDTQLEFIAIMPNEKLSNYINNFSVEEFDKITKASKKSSDEKDGVKIYIPKFSFEYDLSLKDDLMNLGILEAFDDANADFSNMTNDSRGLYVSDALHKANIKFGEKGVKAAAVTVMAMTSKSMVMEPKQPEELKFDKPFLYIIRDKESGEIWFVGTVYEPNLWENDKADYVKNY